MALNFPTEYAEEGEVKVLVPKLEAFVSRRQEYASSKAPVFYNPVMELNRDFAVLAFQAYQRLVNRQIIICEPLAGCGVRGIRLAREVKGVARVVVNDISERACQLAKYNVSLNRLDDKVEVHNEDANFLLSSYAAPRRRFDAVDLDPFGSPAPFLESAVRAVKDDGLLALTATDMAPLCGVHPKACLRKYNGKPLRTEYCHELAVRLLTGLVATVASRHGFAIAPVFSHSTDHYVRVYLRVKHGAREADKSLNKMGYLLHCFNCLHRETLNMEDLFRRSVLCPECGSEMDYAGPLWLGELWNANFYELMVEEADRKKFRRRRRLVKILALIGMELNAPITYYVLDKLCRKAGLPVPSVKKVVAELKNRGYEASPTHFHSKGVRTNASAMEVTNLLGEVNACLRV